MILEIISANTHEVMSMITCVVMFLFMIGGIFLAIQKHRYKSFVRDPIGWTVIFCDNETGVVTGIDDGIVTVLEGEYIYHHYKINELIPIKKPKRK